MTSAPRLLSTASVLVLLLAVAGCYPGGPEVERAALSGDPARFAFPRPLLDRGE